MQNNSLIFARDNDLLWPPIADAIDTFLRRKTKPDIQYERIWRLIHIWEAIEVTLAVAAISKLIERKRDDSVLRKCREYFYGMSWNLVDQEFRFSAGAMDGSIDQWINILNEVSKDDSISTGYLKSLKEFLNTEEISLHSLTQVWGRACDVPLDVTQKDKFATKYVFKYINTFRNRFAHLPFPPDLVNDIATAVEDVTIQMFSIKPLPCKHEDCGKSSPLTGAIVSGDSLLRGLKQGFNTQKVDDIRFIFPVPNSSDKFDPESWSAANFVYIDDLARTYIIAKNKSEAGTIEYIHFKAEANAVINKEVTL
jgi:hypothetical protein